MSEHMWAKIQIGGKLPRTRLVGFAKAVGCGVEEVEHPSSENNPEWGYRCYEDEAHCFCIENEEQCWGEFDEVETLCRELHLPYVRQSDGKYEIAAEICIYRGGDDVECICTDSEGNFILRRDDILPRLRELLQQKQYQTALDLIDELDTDLSSPPAFEVVD